MQRRGRAVHYKTLMLALTSAAMVAGCSKTDLILPGKREALRPAGETVEAANETRSVKVSAASQNTEWTHRIGSPDYRVANAALAATPQLRWNAKIGQGDSGRARITADPVVSGGRIFTMDAAAKVTATSLSGSTLWANDLTPEGDDSDEAQGGGLGFGDGKLFVTNGFGRLTALNPETGAVLWEQKFEAIGSGSPTYFDGLVYVVSGDDVAWAIEADTGRVKWQINGLPDLNNVQSPAAPAVNKRLAIFAYGSGELRGVFRRGGVGLWTAGLTGERLGRTINLISDVSGDPVISGDKVFAANHSGRLIAADLATGERLWTAEEGALSPVWPAGDSLFLVNDQNRLVRLDVRDGTRIWSVDLPLYTKNKPKRQSTLFAHYGPVMAGGLLRVVSSDGLLRNFDPASGAMVSSVEIPGGATTNPVVAGGTLYVVSGKGDLLAFR